MQSKAVGHYVDPPLHKTNVGYEAPTAKWRSQSGRPRSDNARTRYKFQIVATIHPNKCAMNTEDIVIDLGAP